MSKMLWRYLIAVGIMGGSCRRDFTIEGTAGDWKPVLYCIPSTLRDTTYIQFSWSRPLNGGTEVATRTESTDVSFRLNGVEKEVNSSALQKGGISGSLFYVPGRLQEGDKVEVRVALPHGEPVAAKTVIPSEFPLRGVEVFDVEAYGKKAVRFRVTFRDCPETVDYYGIRVWCRHFVEGRSTGNPTPCPLVLNTDREPLMNDKFGVDGVFHLSEGFYQDLYIYDDRKINGRIYTLSLDFIGEDAGTSDLFDDKLLYKLEMYALSEDLYKYLKSLNALNNNDLGKAGLAPVHKKYSNIVNGIGIVAGCNIYETGWMEASSLSD